MSWSVHNHPPNELHVSIVLVLGEVSTPTLGTTEVGTHTCLRTAVCSACSHYKTCLGKCWQSYMSDYCQWTNLLEPAIKQPSNVNPNIKNVSSVVFRLFSLQYMPGEMLAIMYVWLLPTNDYCQWIKQPSNVNASIKSLTSVVFSVYHSQILLLNHFLAASFVLNWSASAGRQIKQWS